MNELEKMIYNLSLPFCKQLNIDLVSVEDCIENSFRIIRVILDSSHDISIDEATKINELISAELDKLDPIPNEYFLEVSSLGVERELKSIDEIKQAIGKYIAIQTKQKIKIGKNGYQEFEGIMIAFDEETITILARIKQFEKEIVIPYQKVSKIRLAIKF